MTVDGRAQIALYCVLLTLLVTPLGSYMTRVFQGERNLLSPVLEPIEGGIYALYGSIARRSSTGRTYVVAMLAFSVVGFIVLQALQRLQSVLPFNPQHLDAVSPYLAVNTSTSFVTNTN